jgi:hypothetical protein
MLVGGNAPFIVDRHSGSIHITGTAFRAEEYLESYARIGRTYPFAVPEHLVVLEGCKPGTLKMSVTKAIRASTGKGLVDARACTDSLWQGKVVTLLFSSAADADRFCCELEPLGVLTRRITRYR